MAASAAQWEVVGKNVKKSKRNTQKNGKMTKSQMKNFIENMPRVKNLDPVKESPTRFDVFLPKDLTKQEENHVGKGSSKHESKTANGGESVSKKNQSKKKGQQEKKKEVEKPKQSLEAAFTSITADEFETFVSEERQRFPDTPLVWLKDLASYLNIKLNVTISDPLFSGKPVDYPLSVMPAYVHQIILDVIEKCPDNVLQLYFEMLITNLVEDMVKGHDVNGHRILIQSLAFMKPSLTLSNLQKFKDLRNQHQNRHPVCLSLLWSLGQGGIKDLGCGIKIWLEMMLPIIGMRAYSKYILDYLDVLFSMHSNIHPCSRVLDIREFFPVLDMVFSHNANLPPALHKQFLALYPKLKTVAFGSNPEQILRNYFPLFLHRLLPDAPLLLQNELKTCLIMCLATDVHCYSVWRQLYTKYLVQSSLLLQHLLSEWDSIGAGLPKKQLRETLGTFKVTNEEIENNSKSQPKGFRDCVQACEALLRKTSVVSMFPWRFLFAMVFSIVGGLFIYDVNMHGSFKGSKTGQVLNDLGVIAVCNHAWIRIKIYSLKLYSWSEENIPIYFSMLCKFCDPYIQLFWNQLYLWGLFIADQTADIRTYLNEKIPQLLEWLNNNLPVLIQNKSELFKEIWSSIQHYALVVGTWLQENVFVGKLSSENLQKCTMDTIETVQHYTVTTYEWIKEQVLAYT